MLAICNLITSERYTSGVKMKHLWLAIVLVVLGWIAWPYYAACDLVTAVQSGDQVALEGRIDWQPLRQGLRDDLNSMFMKKIVSETQQKRDEPGAAFGAGLAALMGPAIIDRAIDAYVTPAGIAALIKNGRPPPRSQPTATAAAIPTTSTTSPDQPEFKLDRVKYAFFSGGPTTFRVEVAPPNGSKTTDSVVLLFRWDGDWRLNRIFFPKDIMK